MLAKVEIVRHGLTIGRCNLESNAMVFNQLSIFDIVPGHELEPEPKSPNCQYHNNTEPTVNDYSPGHPWYYKLGGRVLEPEEIKGVDFSGIGFEPVRRRSVKPSLPLIQQLAAAKRELAAYIDQYNRLVKIGNPI